MAPRYPADIRSEYASRLHLLASDWDTTVAGGLFPPDDRFIDVYTRSTHAVADAQATWIAMTDPAELAQDLEAHNRLRPHHLRRPGPAGLGL